MRSCAGPLRDQEGIVYADIDLKVNEMARGIINITGLYSRWDILSLRVRQEDYEPIVPMEAMENPDEWLPAAPDTAALTAPGATPATSTAPFVVSLAASPAAASPPLTPAQRAVEATAAEIAELRQRIAFLERRLAGTEDSDR